MDIAGAGNVGGAIGFAGGGTIGRVYATGRATCTAVCGAGGLMGSGSNFTVDRSYASGPVSAGGTAGGLVGGAFNSFTIQRSHALGPVTGAGGSARAGGLVGQMVGGTLAQVYAIGRVAGAAGATVGGLVGQANGMNTVTNAYWDINTSAQAASAAGIGYSTSQLRAVMPIGFRHAWAITRNRSYPFLDDGGIEFTAPLATLVKSTRVFTFRPISQRDKSQYAGASTGANAASLAAVYTMIARAIGITRNVATLKDVPIDRYWKDATKTAVWNGPVTTRATVGELKTLGANARLNNANVIGEMKVGRLVMLRGSYTRNNGAKVEHWLLGTLYTTSGNVLDSVIANDPWTGMQVMIDPSTKKVVSPAAFPLANFKVDGYRPVTLN